jgi:hypothetical protein
MGRNDLHWHAKVDAAGIGVLGSDDDRTGILHDSIYEKLHFKSFVRV